MPAWRLRPPIIAMLPLNTRRPHDPEANNSFAASPITFGRPLRRWRWAICILVCLVVLWLFGPSFVALLHPYLNIHIPPSPGHQPPPPAWVPPDHALAVNQSSPVLASIWVERSQKVRGAFVHAYDAYRIHAAKYDEIKPVSGQGTNNLNGWGSTVFDSLDTMWIMGLNETFNDALAIVARSDFSVKLGNFVPFFETVIRYLGGLLSAYALSGEPVLLVRADDLGRMLLGAFNTSTGLPMYAVNTMTGETRQGWTKNVLWAEAMSNQLEYKYLAHLTGRAEYFNNTQRIVQLMYDARPHDDIYPTMWDLSTGKPANDHFSVGAYADSAHEYLLKQWLLTAHSEPKLQDLYLRSTNAVIAHLLYITPAPRHLLYVTDTTNLMPSHTHQHLACFLPGILALGVHTLRDLSTRVKELHGWAAEGLARTCWATYVDSETGLGPDEVQMKVGSGGNVKWADSVKQWEVYGRPGGAGPPGTGELERVGKDDGEKGYTLNKSSYLLRPETIESFYILWRTTGNVKWRERGWTIFEAIENHTRTERGYASIYNVNSLPVSHMDEMPSYFLAETLKYLYLLFSDGPDPLPLDKWVFNTEAHPLPVFEWKEWEKKRYAI